MNVAKSVREKKLLRPDAYCSHPQCLWRTQTRDGFKPCPTHGVVSRLLGVRELPERNDSALDAPTAPVLPTLREAAERQMAEYRETGKVTITGFEAT